MTHFVNFRRQFLPTNTLGSLHCFGFLETLGASRIKKRNLSKINNIE